MNNQILSHDLEIFQRTCNEQKTVDSGQQNRLWQILGPTVKYVSDDLFIGHVRRHVRRRHHRRRFSDRNGRFSSLI